MSSEPPSSSFQDLSFEDLKAIFDRNDYVADDSLMTPVWLALRLGKPLLVEGEPGCGKTELGKVLSQGFDTPLIRLQCYEGMTAEKTLYEWNYTKQLLAVQAGERSVEEEDRSVFQEDFLLERPLLRAIRRGRDRPPVLLIDEIDRADEPFEAFLLEILSDFQVSIPELGTVEADKPPIVVITSNRTRGLSDALKRRCLYLHINPPSMEKERSILHRKVPQIKEELATEICAMKEELRNLNLLKQPGVSELLDWARAMAELIEDGVEPMSDETLRNTLTCLLKEAEDVRKVDDELLRTLREAADRADESVPAPSDRPT